MTSGPGWQFRLLLLHTLLVQTVTFVVRPTTSYRALELGVPGEALGGLSAAFALVPLLLALGVGRVTDRWGERVVILLGGVGLCGATVLLLTSSGLTGLVIGTALLGLGHLLSMVGEQALVANTSTDARRDSRFGHYTFAASAGQVAGPGLISLFDASSAVPDTDALFTAACVLALVGVLLGLALRRSRAAVPEPADRTSGGARRLLRTPGLLRALLASSVVLAAVDISLAYFPALGQERGFSAALVSLLLAVRAAASMVSRLFLGRLAASVGRRRLLLVSVTGSGLTVAALALPLPVPLVLVVVTVAGLVLGVGQPLTMSWVAGTAPPRLRGTAMSLRITGNRLGQVTIPAVAGLAAGLGTGGVFLTTGCLLLAVALAVRRLPMEDDPSS
ncbi:MFS transporter [Modestobacter sp. I12A-02662]|uniref:MFS transporter n=1 Tax=Modestobacter sp. I12A-02662 TaxID=1730496 RepID=UPI0034DDE59C